MTEVWINYVMPYLGGVGLAGLLIAAVFMVVKTTAMSKLCKKMSQEAAEGVVSRLNGKITVDVEEVARASIMPALEPLESWRNHYSQGQIALTKVIESLAEFWEGSVSITKEQSQKLRDAIAEMREINKATPKTATYHVTSNKMMQTNEYEGVSNPKIVTRRPAG